MTQHVAIICRPELVGAFGLAGLAAEAAEDSTEVTRQVLRHRDAGTSFVLIQQELLDALPQRTRHAWEHRALPAIVPFPGPTWRREAPAEHYIIEILRQAVGYRVKA